MLWIHGSTSTCCVRHRIEGSEYVSSLLLFRSVSFSSVISYEVLCQTCGATRYPCPTEVLSRSWPKCWKAVNFSKGLVYDVRRKHVGFVSILGLKLELSQTLPCITRIVIQQIHNNSMHWRSNSVAQVESFPRHRGWMAHDGTVQGLDRLDPNP